MRERYALKYPPCKEDTLIQRGDTNYECIYCGYTKELGNQAPGFSSFIILGFIFFIILLAILQDFARQQSNLLTPGYAPSMTKPAEQRYP